MSGGTMAEAELTVAEQLAAAPHLSKWKIYLTSSQVIEGNFLGVRGDLADFAVMGHTISYDHNWDIERLEPLAT